MVIVAFYGKKPALLAALIADCQTRLQTYPDLRFEPYALEQVHASIVGVPPISDPASIADFDRFLSFIRSGPVPFQVQIAGFRRRPYPFTSRATDPFQRSVSLSDGKAVVIGWPIRGLPLQSQPADFLDLLREARMYPNSLDDLRLSTRAFGFSHRYHTTPTDVDNDFYFRIGLFDAEATSSEAIRTAESHLRESLASADPLVVEVALSDLFLVESESEFLLPSTSHAWSLADAAVTGASVMREAGRWPATT